jgi:hypothetical protein
VNKPRGGRGKAAPYETTHVRVPLPIKDEVTALIEKWHNSQGPTQDSRELASDCNPLTGNEKPLTNIVEVVEIARQVLAKKKSARASMGMLIKAIFGEEIEL